MSFVSLGSLASLYNPIDATNRRLSLPQIRTEIGQKLKDQLEQMKSRVQGDQRQDDRWYYVVPLLMDQDHPAMKAWFQSRYCATSQKLIDGVDEYEDDKGILSLHLQELKGCITSQTC